MEKPAPVIPKGSLWGSFGNQWKRFFTSLSDRTQICHAVSDFELLKKLLHTHYFNTTTALFPAPAHPSGPGKGAVKRLWWFVRW